MEKLHLPGGYDAVLEEFAEKNKVEFNTAFFNLMDFVQLKDYAFTEVKILIEEPDCYLEGGEEIQEEEVLLAFMESFGENTVGATVHGYYHRKNSFLTLEISYDDALSCWEILSMFQRKIPSMEVVDGSLYLFYIRDAEEERFTPASFPLISSLGEEEEKYGKAGYFESIYVDEEDFSEEEDSFSEDESSDSE
jgi:hypothetical protein